MNKTLTNIILEMKQIQDSKFQATNSITLQNWIDQLTELNQPKNYYKIKLIPDGEPIDVKWLSPAGAFNYTGINQSNGNYEIYLSAIDSVEAVKLAQEKLKEYNDGKLKNF